jgi:hypothetical protein
MKYHKSTGSWHPTSKILRSCRSHLKDKIFPEVGVLHYTMRNPNWDNVTVSLKLMDDSTCIMLFYLTYES